MGIRNYRREGTVEEFEAGYWRPSGFAFGYAVTKAGAVTPHRERVAARRRSPAATTSAPVGGLPAN